MKKKQKHIALLAFGANLPSCAGTPSETLLAAAKELGEAGLDIAAFSSLYRTEAETLQGGEPVPDFINAAAAVQTNLKPDQLLDLFHATERQFGRTPAARWSARPLDIDLLAWDDIVLPSPSVWRELESSPDPAAILPEPVVPHPRLHKRGFVLAPLNEVAPDWHHPVLGRSVAALYVDMEAADALSGVQKITAG